MPPPTKQLAAAREIAASRARLEVVEGEVSLSVKEAAALARADARREAEEEITALKQEIAAYGEGGGEGRVRLKDWASPAICQTSTNGMNESLPAGFSQLRQQLEVGS